MILEREEQLGPSMPAGLRHFVTQQLLEHGGEVFTGCEVVRVTEGRVTAITADGARREFPPAIVIAALGRRSLTDLAEACERLGVETHIIGDARAPRTLHDAIREGAEVGRAI